MAWIVEAAVACRQLRRWRRRAPAVLLILRTRTAWCGALSCVDFACDVANFIETSSIPVHSTLRGGAKYERLSCGRKLRRCGEVSLRGIVARATVSEQKAKQRRRAEACRGDKFEAERVTRGAGHGDITAGLSVRPQTTLDTVQEVLGALAARLSRR